MIQRSGFMFIQHDAASLACWCHPQITLATCISACRKKEKLLKHINFKTFKTNSSHLKTYCLINSGFSLQSDTCKKRPHREID